MTTDQWGKGNYLKVKVAKALQKEDELFTKSHIFKVEKDKKKIPKGATAGKYGSWIKKKNPKALKEYLKIKKENAKYYY